MAKKIKKPKARELPKSEAESAMVGGEAPVPWPCGGRCPPATCSHEGSFLQGTITDYDAHGGMAKVGTVDVLQNDGDVVRFYLNSNARSAFDSAIRNGDLDEHNLRGVQIAAKFEKWVLTNNGRNVRTFLVGLAAAPQEEV